MYPDDKDQAIQEDVTDEIMEVYANSEQLDVLDHNQNRDGIMPSLGRSWVNDIRADESLGLIAACRINSSLLEPYRKAIAEAGYGLLDDLHVHKADEDRQRAIDDVAAVMAAYFEARKAYEARVEAIKARRAELDANPDLGRVVEKESGQTKRKVSKNATGETDSYAEVRKIVDQIVNEAERMASFEQSIEGLLKTDAGAMARNMLEEAALSILLQQKKGYAPPYRPSVLSRPSASQFKPFARSRQAIAKGAFLRHGASLIQRNQGKGRVALGRVAEFSQRYGAASDTAVELSKFSSDVVDLLWGNGNGTLLYDASLSVAATLSRTAEPSAAITPPPNAVLVIGALELFCAWRPKERVVSGADKDFATLVTDMYVALFPQREEMDWNPRSTIVEICRAWKAGRSAILFDGRDPSRTERYALLRKMFLDQENSAHKDLGEDAENREYGIGRVRPRVPGK